MKDNLTPEDRLLRLIRKGKSDGTVTEKKNISDNQKPVQLQEPAAIEYPGNFLIQKYASFFSLHKIIPLLFISGLIYLAISLVYPFIGPKEISLPKIDSEKSIFLEPGLKQEVKPYEYYLKGVENRQIFSSSGTASKDAARPLAGANIDITKDISLVGIVSGDNPQAVIEDKKAQKTYYLNKGQFIGEAQIQDIKEGKVIINYQGQNYELYL